MTEDQYVEAVEAQRPAVEKYAAAIAGYIAEGQRTEAVGATYMNLLNDLYRDPNTYTAVLTMALVMLAEQS